MTRAADADFTFVHVTDTHIIAGERLTARDGTWSMDTQDTLERVIRTINTLETQPAFVVVGGDLTNPDALDLRRHPTPEEYEPSYRLLQQIVGELNCPVHMLMGNHDDRTAFHRVMQHRVPEPDFPHYFSFDHDGYHIVCLDTQEPGQGRGYVDDTQLTWLRDDLHTHVDQPAIAFMHHHPWEIGIGWLDGQNLRNGNEVVQCFRDHGQVPLMICGHVHLEQTQQKDGLTQVTSPATSFHISNVSQTSKIFSGPPGFRMVRVKGLEWSTQVVYLHHDGADEI